MSGSVRTPGSMVWLARTAGTVCTLPPRLRVGDTSSVRLPARTTIAAGGTVIAVAAMASMPLRDRPAEAMYELFMVHNGPSGIVLLGLGWLVLRHQPRNAAAAVLLVMGVVSVLHVVVTAVLDARLVAHGIDIAAEPAWEGVVPDQLPLDASLPLMVMSTVWVPAAVLPMTMLLLLFPDGHLPGQRWRVVAGAALVGIALMMTGFGVGAWPTAGAEDPVIAQVLIAAGGLVVLLAVAGSVTAFVVRWRRAKGAERTQFRVVGAAACAFAVVATVLYPWQPIWIPAVLVAFTLLLVVYGLAMARYRLHDLEPVLGRAAVGAILAVGVAALYVAIVVGVGGLVGWGTESTVLPLVAVAVVAVLIEPARRRVRLLVDRVLYGRQVDRTQVLSRLAALASTATPEHVLSEVATLLVRSTGASRAEVWLDVDPVPVLAAASGGSDEAGPLLRADVVHHEERLGELRLYARAAADLVSDVSELLDDVAHSLGVVVRNARLTAQLRAQLDELRQSRQRLVEAHDQARRGMERDIHDGAQSRLIAVRLRVGLAAALAETDDGGDGAAVREQLTALGAEVDAAVRSLRELARGLHPPILEQSGVAAALRAHVRDLPLSVAVEADGIGRYDRTIEGAVYFACLESMQNAIRHGGAARVVIVLRDDREQLRFSVRDDGAGFDQRTVAAGAGLANIDDRVSALGGTCRVDSAPGAGTHVRGEIPLTVPRGK